MALLLFSFLKLWISEATGEVGDVTVILPASVTVAISGFASATGSVGTVSVEEGIVVSATGSSSTASVGSVTVSVSNVIAAPTGIASTSAVGSVTVTTNVTYAVTVASGTNAYGTGNKYYVNGSVSPTLTLNEGNTYWFDQSDSSNSGHPLRF